MINLTNTGHFFKTYAIPRPYYSGWVLNKISPWTQKINRHILLVQQVGKNQDNCSDPHLSQAGIDLKPRRKLFFRLSVHDHGEGGLEVMGLQYFILPFIILVIGLGLSTAVWTIELGKHRLDKKQTKTNQMG